VNVTFRKATELEQLRHLPPRALLRPSTQRRCLNSLR
jgi:hypothetical protein